ncbi:AvrE-family type 3 secretion system effector [Vibrio quintilis]|uniref:Pathogenicity factor n=1 Tax=Vibrio quintilis TaxID=1117707 RepID=A0A1M7YSY8_9VIBR|nr:AvrE-family type 3 secretion system effector [Vibrio quintilis]SHO55709.1 Pathogenicity factor [Vibrio quintilis]
MRIQSTSLHHIDQIQATSSQRHHSLHLVQKNKVAQHGEVISLARQGSQSTAPTQLTQRTTTPDNQPVARTKNQTLSGLKRFFGFGTGKEKATSSEIQPEQRATQALSHRQSLGDLFAAEDSRRQEPLSSASATDASMTSDAEDPEVTQHFEAFKQRQAVAEAARHLPAIEESAHEGVDTDIIGTHTELNQHFQVYQQRKEQIKQQNHLPAIEEGDHEGIDPEQGKVLETPRFNLKNGRLMPDKEMSPAVATILTAAFNEPSRHYIAHESHQDGQEQLMLDKQGRVFEIASHSETGLIALHSSTPMINPQKVPESLHTHLTQSGQPVGEKSYLSVATGVHTDDQGRHFRMHHSQLHQLNDQGVWEKHDSDISQLSTQGDHQLYGLKNKQQLVSISSGQEGEDTGQEITSFSMSQSGRIACLLKQEDDQPGKLTIMTSLTAKADETTELTTHLHASSSSETALHLAKVGMTDDQLFAIDQKNNLLAAPLPASGKEAHFKPVDTTRLKHLLGQDIQFEGFTHHGEGGISLLAKDKHDHTHACPLNPNKQTFRPGWNLTDVLHLDNQQGLMPAGEDKIHVQNFGQRGELAAHDGKLFAKDKMTRQWVKVDDKIEGLHRGRDGLPYAIKDGELKKITFQQKTETIGFGHSDMFTLSQSRGKPKLDEGPKGTPEGKIKAAAVLNNHRHITLDENGQLTYTRLKPGTEKPAHPPLNISQHGVSGEIKQLSVDESQTLHALTEDGKLFTLQARDWQRPHRQETDIQWQEHTLPELPEGQQITHLDLNASRQITLTTDQGETLSKVQDQWKTNTSTEAQVQDNSQSSIRDQLFDHLSAGTKNFKLNKHGGQYQVTAEAGGFSGLESHQVSTSFKSRLKAHVFKPTLEVPRPLTTAANSVQHTWKGRAGLTGLYQQEQRMFKMLDKHTEQLASGLLPPRPDKDIKTRIDQLETGEAGASLKEQLEAFRNELEQSAHSRLLSLGQHQGILNDSGAVKTDYQPPRFKAATQALNPNRSGHDLSAELLNTWKHAPSSEQSHPEKLLQQFTDNKLNMSHQKTEIPLGRQRDPNDQMALVKSRLVLDTMAMQKLDHLLNAAELMGDLSDGESIDLLQQQLSEIRDDFYGKNQIKHFTDQGMQSHQDAEANYDATKYFIRVFNDSEHGVNQITKAALEATDQTELNQKMKSLLHSLKSSDSVAINRNYGAETAGAFIPAPLLDHIVGMFPTGGAGIARNYDISFSGQDNDSIQVTISSNFGYSGKLGFGAAKDVLPEISGKSASELSKKFNDGQQTFRPGAVLVASLTASGSKVTHNEVSFTVQGKDIDQFIDGLTNGKITPDQLVNKGIEHTSTHGNKWNFSLDLALTAQARAGADMAKSGQLSNSDRLGAGISASVNLAGVNKEKMHKHGLENSATSQADKSGLFNSASASASVGLTSVNIHKDENGLLPVSANVQAAVSVSIDNSVSVKGEVKTAPAAPVSHTAIKTMFDSLEKAFPDVQNKTALKAAKAQETPAKQLEALNQHFFGNHQITPVNDKQYDALNKIRSHTTQQKAADQQADMMSEPKAVISHSNPAHLDKAGMIDFLSASLGSGNKMAVARQVHHLMEQDPGFTELLNRARSGKNAKTSVTLELKDDVKLRLEEAFVQGKISLKDIQKALENPENRRIKSIGVTESRQHKEGFSSPVALAGGTSSNSISMGRDAGTITFKYGASQNMPKGYELSGEVVHSEPELAQAIRTLKMEGLDVRA